MANGTQKSNNHRNFYAVVAVILLLAAIGIYLRGCGNDAGTAELYQRTDAAVGAVEKQHETAGRELDVVGGQLDSAGETVGRADQLIATGEERIAENAASLADCQRIVSECRKIIADCQRLYSEVEETNRSGAGSSSGS